MTVWSVSVSARTFSVQPSHFVAISVCHRFKSLAAAKAALAAAGCATGTVTTASSGGLHNHVLHQSRLAGARLARGTRINLILGH